METPVINSLAPQDHIIGDSAAVLLIVECIFKMSYKLK